MIQNGRVGLDSQLVTPAGGEAVKGAVVFVMGSGGGDVRDYVRGYKEQLVESIFLPRDIAILHLALLAFGELDSMVPPEQNSERFNEIFPTAAPANITWFTTLRSDHMFRITDTVCFDYYGFIDNPHSEEFRTVLTGWVDENVAR